MDHIHTGLNPNCKVVFPSPRVPSFRKQLLGVQGAVVYQPSGCTMREIDTCGWSNDRDDVHHVSASKPRHLV